MSNPRNWVIKKLKEDEIARSGEPHKEYSIESVAIHGLRVVRWTRPDALVYCAGVDTSETFDLDDLDRARLELPGVQFVAVIPTRITHSAYARAASLGLCVDGFGELKSALHQDDDVSCHQDREQAYLMHRLTALKVVTSVRRRGHKSYEIERSNLQTLTIVTIDRYELTSDDIYSLLESYSGLNVDAVAITNPNAQFLSRDSLNAGRQADVRILLLRELLDALDKSWT